MVRRRQPPENKVNHERWLVSYADFITLLFAFFVVMYSVSQVSENKYRVLSETLGEVFQGRLELPSAQDWVADSELTPEALARRVRSTLDELVAADSVNVSATDAWVEVSVNANLLFPSGSAEPGTEARTIFARVSELLAGQPNAIEVSGHTDNVPIDTTEFSNNWELSSARATAVVELLADNGIEPSRLSAVGYGEYRPVADNATEAGRAANRRVVLKIARQRVAPPRVELESLPESLHDPAADVTSAGVPDVKVPAGRQASGDDEQAAQKETPKPSVRPVEPVRLEDGGLLFTNEPGER